MATPDLTYDLHWDANVAADEAEATTWGTLRFQVAGEPVWGDDKGHAGVHWTWIDLLEHLSDIWPWLVWEDGWPAGDQFRGPIEFLESRKAWLDRLSPEDAQRQEDALFEFRHRHDLAMAVRGKFLPSLWIVRQGRQAWVATPTRATLMEFGLVKARLTQLGDEIATRLAVVTTDERAREAINGWKRRLVVGVEDATAISVGVAKSELLSLVSGSVYSMFELEHADVSPEWEGNELVAAARMSVRQTAPEIVRLIVDAMRALPKGDCTKLDALSAAAAPTVDAQLEPHAQGRALARWLRAHIGAEPDARVDPDVVLRKHFSVQVGEFTAQDDGIDAVACWGLRHGPAVLVNTQGRHSGEYNGRRSTFAHELAHLLVDRAAALPLAEVMGGNVARPVEQRARAFAAEFLLPAATAGSAFFEKNAAEVLDSLCATYAVSAELVAWQAYNSGSQLDWSTFKLLRRQVRHPERFPWRGPSRVG